MLARAFDRYDSIVTMVAMSVLAACADPSEPPRVELPVVVDASGIVSVTSDLGYEVDVVSARIAMDGLVFTVAGEAHTASLPARIAHLFVPAAHAHPGHYQGGEVTGEMPGAFVVEWPADDGRELGVATLLAGTYTAANFEFARAGAAQPGGDDPLTGHTAIISGTAAKDGVTTSFTLVVDSPEGRELVGAPFEADVRSGSRGALHFVFHTMDPNEGDTLFDGIDFAVLDADGDGVLEVAPDDADVEDAYNTFRRNLQTHDHYAVYHEE